MWSIIFNIFFVITQVIHGSWKSQTVEKCDKEEMKALSINVLNIYTIFIIKVIKPHG